ncbi:hypothetical protein EBU99_11210 [bacterium]|nr:hypothetical protein [bacterium]
MHPRASFPSLRCILSITFSLFAHSAPLSSTAFASPQDPTSCANSDQDCIKQALHSCARENKKNLGYDGARQVMFQKVDVYLSPSGERVVKSVYSPDVFPVGVGIPRTGVNTEHTWPQTFLKKAGVFDEARADLFHIFPSEIKINGVRGSYPFKECNHDSNIEGSMCGSSGFEPPEEHKGIVARAMFYMSITYSMHIDNEQENTLRNWAKTHVVSNSEVQRADKIKEEQGNRNPFIDHPEWIEMVKDF